MVPSPDRHKANSEVRSGLPTGAARFPRTGSVPGMSDATLTPALATAYATVALANVTTEFPNAPQHVLMHRDERVRPAALHPAFYGSFDWHSSVHMHWTLLRLLRRFPDLPEAGRVREVLDAHLTPAALVTEARYLDEHPIFERPYGWGWALALAAEALAGGEPTAAWSAALRPLADAVERRFVDWLPRATYPVRAGTHASSAFALVLALRWQRAASRAALGDAIADATLRWFSHDADYPAAWEPSGEDFLSAALVEAVLMREVVGEDAFGDWLAGFLPGLAAGDAGALLTPATVADRSDYRIVHLDGLNLSRAWCWRRIAAALDAADPRRPVAERAAAEHLAAALPHVATGGYGGDHWLASFAVLALDG
jgi:Protein of unknown function (DUF2891)